MNSKQFGGKLTKDRKAIYESSKNWQNGAFKNLTETQTAISLRKFPEMLCKQLKGRKDSYPTTPLPVIPLNIQEFLQPSNDAKYVWYGHSVVLIRQNNHTILIDPMFGEDASPIAPKKTKRFSENTLALIDALPTIDVVLITHDHYDHLDFDSILKLKNKVSNFCCALGVKRHLESWGIDSDKIVEMDWWDEHNYKEIKFTFTPTRHFSGRGLTSLAKSLWGGWAITTNKENIWFSGDGGYAPHFKEIGNQLGPFDIAFMECGQYGKEWENIHMFPHNSVQAALDAKVKNAVPVHWAGFNLSYQHAWFEPIEEFMKYADEKGLNYITPAIGELFTIATPTNKWWLPYK